MRVFNELKDALNKSNQAIVDPDGMCYKFLTNIPWGYLNILPSIFCAIWLSGVILSCWVVAIVVSMPNMFLTTQFDPYYSYTIIMHHIQGFLTPPPIVL